MDRTLFERRCRSLFLIDNGSTDDYRTILEPYIKNKLIDLVVNNKKHAQSEHYGRFINECKQYTWVAIVDLDEFIYARLEYNTIALYLRSLNDNINAVIVPWKMFGSSGHHIQPNGVVNNFTLRKKYNETDEISVKSIVKSKNLIRLGVHVSNLNNLSSIILTNSVKTTNESVQQINEKILNKSRLYLNHYPIQSLEWFQQIKITRGDASNPLAEKIRDMDYFKQYDYKDMIDNELKIKRNS